MVLGILISVLVGMLFLRNDVEADILRLPGQLYERKGEHIISNVYTYKLVNKTNNAIEDVTFKLLSHKGTISIVSHDTFTVPAGGLAEGTLFIEVNATHIMGGEITWECVKSGPDIGKYILSEDYEENTSTRWLEKECFLLICSVKYSLYRVYESIEKICNFRLFVEV